VGQQNYRKAPEVRTRGGSKNEARWDREGRERGSPSQPGVGGGGNIGKAVVRQKKEVRGGQKGGG